MIQTVTVTVQPVHGVYLLYYASRHLVPPPCQDNTITLITDAIFTSLATYNLITRSFFLNSSLTYIMNEELKINCATPCHDVKNLHLPLNMVAAGGVVVINARQWQRLMKSRTITPEYPRAAGVMSGPVLWRLWQIYIIIHMYRVLNTNWLEDKRGEKLLNLKGEGEIGYQYTNVMIHFVSWSYIVCVKSFLLALVLEKYKNDGSLNCGIYWHI